MFINTRDLVLQQETRIKYKKIQKTAFHSNEEK